MALIDAGGVLLRDARVALDAVAAAARRTRRAADLQRPLVLVTKGGASHELLQRLLAAAAADTHTARVEVVLCEVGEQARFLRTGRADVALMHRPVDDLAGFGRSWQPGHGRVDYAGRHSVQGTWRAERDSDAPNSVNG